MASTDASIVGLVEAPFSWWTAFGVLLLVSVKLVELLIQALPHITHFSSKCCNNEVEFDTDAGEAHSAHSSSSSPTVPSADKGVTIKE